MTIQKSKFPSIKNLLDSGAHFGHLRARSHPRAKQFSFEVRDRIVVIDLDKTLAKLQETANWCREIAKEGKILLFVGTKRQVQDLVEAAAKKVSMPYVTNRWLAGTLTNFDEIFRNVRKLERLEKELASQSSGTTKREKVKLQTAVDKLHKTLDGIASLTGLPDALFVVDAAFENIAIDEANRLGIPVAAITDTNVNPDRVKMPIPANDDSRLAVEAILGVITDAVTEGKSKTKTAEGENRQRRSTKIENKANER